MSRLIMLLTVGLVGIGITACSKVEHAPAVGQVSPARPTNPSEYKLSFHYEDVKESGTLSGEVLFRENRVYQFLTGSDEVVVIDPAGKTVHLLDFRRKATTELKFSTIEGSLEKYRKDLRTDISGSEATNTRAGRLEAAMDRDLLDPRFKVEPDNTGLRLRLLNPTIEVDATGEPDRDELRLERIEEALALTAKLRALRVSDGIPPFAQLDTLSALCSARKLRPVQLTFLFRLTGPPEKYRWSYSFTPTLTEREWEALQRIDSLLLSTGPMSFERYERLIERIRLH